MADVELVIKLPDYIVESVKISNVCKYEKFKIFEAIKNGTPLNETKASTDKTRSYTHKTRHKAVQQLKKYTETKKNTDKVEISVWVLNRIINALSQDPVDCANADHDADGCLGYSTDRGGYSYCQTCIECPKASINNRDKEQEPCDDTRPHRSIVWTPEDSLYVEQGMLYD